MPSDDRLLPLAEIFERHDPSREAVVCGGVRRSYEWLDLTSSHYAVWLAGRGVSHGDIVPFALPNGPEFLALTFAIYRRGAVPAPLSPKLPDRERDEILMLLDPCVFIQASDLPETDRNGTSSRESLPPSPSWKACTSGGSSGRPKVVVDARPASFAFDMEFVGIPADGRIFVPGPLYHNATFGCAVFALWRGSTVVTMSHFDAADALELVADEKVEWALMVPTMMSRVLDLPEELRNARDLSSWKAVVHTAAPMAASVKRAWIDWLGPDHVWEVYGSTEGLVRCWIGGREWLERPGSVGRPLGGARIRIMDGQGEQLPCGATGEIYAIPPGGPGSTYRYIGADRKALPDGWESVGDAGWIDAHGYLFLADRVDDMIISGGVNIWPAEVEAALMEHPDIRSCAVYGVEDADLGAKVHAIIEADACLTLDDVRAFLAGRLSRPKHPRTIEVRTDPVRDDAGKFRKPRTKALQ